MSKDTPVFPKVEKVAGYTDVHHDGLTKREYFSGVAMQGLISSECFSSRTNLAELSVKIADALIEELGKKEDSNGE